MRFIYFFLILCVLGSIKCDLPTTEIDIGNGDKNVLLDTSLNAKLNWMMVEMERMNKTIYNINERIDLQEKLMKNYSADSKHKTVHKILQYPPLKQFVDLLKYKKSTKAINEMLPNQTLQRLGNWVVILRRQDGSENFDRNWLDYKNGFGNPKREFFIGLDRLHAVTNGGKQQELLIVLGDFENNTRYALYDDFVVGNETEKYKLKKLGNFSGDAGDALTDHVNQKFTTKDQDNDIHEKMNCAEVFVGAWWHHYCCESLLTGKYYLKPRSNEKKGIIWYNWRGHYYSLKFAEMMVRSTS